MNTVHTDRAHALGNCAIDMSVEWPRDSNNMKLRAFI